MHLMTYKLQIQQTVLHIMVQQYEKKDQRSELLQDHSNQMKVYVL